METSSLGVVLAPVLGNTFAGVMDSGIKSTLSKSAKDIWLHGAVDMLEGRNVTGRPGQAWEVGLCEHEAQQRKVQGPEPQLGQAKDKYKLGRERKAALKRTCACWWMRGRT